MSLLSTVIVIVELLKNPSILVRTFLITESLFFLIYSEDRVPEMTR